MRGLDIDKPDCIGIVGLPDGEGFQTTELKNTDNRILTSSIMGDLVYSNFVHLNLICVSFVTQSFSLKVVKFCHHCAVSVSLALIFLKLSSFVDGIIVYLGCK